MKIRRLEISALSLPLRKPFRTAAGERQSSDSVVVRLELDDGTVGHGEGIPRDYVTGETVDTCFDYLSSITGVLDGWNPADFGSLVETLWDFSEHAPDSPPSYSARCALELALLDAAMKRFNRSFDDVFSVLPDLRELHRPRTVVRYSVVASLDDPRRAWRTALKYRLYGFGQVKVKVGPDARSDAAGLAAFRRLLGKSVEMRVDANGIWTLDEAVERMKQLLPFNIASVEQPLSRGDSTKLRELRTRVSIPVVLDESLIGQRDAMLAIDGHWGDIFNLRLSKCGGFLACLRLAELARRAGLACQLGCHPGETAILSAAGRHFASCVGPLAALEGSYDRHVLAANVIDGDITFGFGGKAPRLAGPGLGIAINPQKLRSLAMRSQTLEIS